jgi:spore germination protein YaaH
MSAARFARRFAVLCSLALCVSAGSIGCGVESGDPIDRFGPGADATLPKRRGSVVVEGCALDAYQTDVLAGAPAHAVLQEVVLVCPTVDEQGALAPSDATAQAALSSQVAQLRKLGYVVTLGIGARDADGSTPAPTPLAARFENDAYRVAFLKSLYDTAMLADGVELAMPPIGASARDRLTALVRVLGEQVHPAKRVGLFAPPSYTTPSDLPNADVWDLAALGPSLDRVRLMTVDYTDPRGPAGPTTDPGWAVQVWKTARARSPAATIDVTLPLYGWDYAGGQAKAVSYLDAIAIAKAHGVTPTRLPIGEPTFDYRDAGGLSHTVVYDDTLSLTRALLAWDTSTVDPSVGVTFYGLGAEDPALFPKLATGKGGSP